MKNKTVSVPKEKLKQMIIEEARRIQKYPTQELIDDLLKEVHKNMKELQRRVPTLLQEACGEDRHARMVRNDLAALNERLVELVSILKAGDDDSDAQK